MTHMTLPELTKAPPYVAGREEAVLRWTPSFSYRPGCDPITDFVLSIDRLLVAELDATPKFTDEEAFALLVNAQGTAPSPHLVGQLLLQEIEDDPETMAVHTELSAKLEKLTLGQDWAIRMLLDAHATLRRDNPAITLRELGFPLI